MESLGKRDSFISISKGAAAGSKFPEGIRLVTSMEVDPDLKGEAKGYVDLLDNLDAIKKGGIMNVPRTKILDKLGDWGLWL